MAEATVVGGGLAQYAEFPGVYDPLALEPSIINLSKFSVIVAGI
jgi:hypothetical protein